jgi:metal-responsive CopG/Arc/MetJ family transcriptional regulator
MATPTVSMEDKMDKKIEQRLQYGDSKSKWIRGAIRMRLAADKELGVKSMEDCNRLIDAIKESDEIQLDEMDNSIST